MSKFEVGSLVKFVPATGNPDTSETDLMYGITPVMVGHADNGTKLVVVESHYDSGVLVKDAWNTSDLPSEWLYDEEDLCNYEENTDD